MDGVSVRASVLTPRISRVHNVAISVNKEMDGRGGYFRVQGALLGTSAVSRVKWAPDCQAM